MVRGILEAVQRPCEIDLCGDRAYHTKYNFMPDEDQVKARKVLDRWLANTSSLDVYTQNGPIFRLVASTWSWLTGQSAVASCDSSQITIILDMPNLDGWIAAMITAEDIATITVGALGFSLGSGYWVELIQVTEEDGTPHVFGVRPTDPTSGATLGIEPQNELFNRAFRLSGHNLFFRLAIRDYLRAITDVKDCATYCYRAIESIKSAFVFETGVNSWDEMHRVLGTDRSSITSLVKDYADPVRHGNWIEARPTDIFIRFRMLEFTRDILIKYLNHEQPAI